DRKGAAFADLGLDDGKHLLLAFLVAAGKGADARSALRVPKERSDAVRNPLAVSARPHRPPAPGPLPLRQLETLRAIEEKLYGLRLHDARRRALDAHRKAAAVGEAAACDETWYERIAGDTDGLAGFLFVEAGECNLRVQTEGGFDGLSQGHAVSFG